LKKYVQVKYGCLLNPGIVIKINKSFEITINHQGFMIIVETSATGGLFFGLQKELFFLKKTSADCRAKRLDLGLVALENQVVEGETFAKCGCIGMPFSISMAFFIRLLFDLSNEKNNCSQKKPSYLPSIFKKSI